VGEDSSSDVALPYNRKFAKKEKADEFIPVLISFNKMSWCLCFLLKFAESQDCLIILVIGTKAIGATLTCLLLLLLLLLYSDQ